MTTHRVLVVDDEASVLDIYQTFFVAVPDWDVVATADTGARAVQAYAEHRPDLVLMDLQLPVMTGIDATAEICRRWPEARVLVMTTFSTGEHVVAALRAGAAGYLVKDVGGPGLLAAMGQALAGEMPLSGAVRHALVAAVVDEQPATPRPVVALSPREAEALDGLARGLTNQQIGTRMHVSEGSVKQYVSALGRKLGAASRTAILVRAIRAGLVDPNDLAVEP